MRELIVATKLADIVTFIAHYMHYYSHCTAEFDTIEEAVAFLCRGEDAGELSSKEVCDSFGDVIFSSVQLHDIYRENWDGDKLTKDLFDAS